MASASAIGNAQMQTLNIFPLSIFVLCTFSRGGQQLVLVEQRGARFRM
jgi:hypothetical protein